MDALTQLKDAERRVAERLRELEPLAREYEQLKAEADRLGISAVGAPAASPSHTRRRARRREQVLDVVRTRGQTTVSQVARDLDVDPTGLYRVVRMLVKDGDVIKTGTSLTPAPDRRA